MRRLRTLAAVASIAVIAACGSGSDDDTTTVPEDGGGSSETESNESTGSAVPIVGTQWMLDEVDAGGASIQTDADTSAYLRINEAGEVTGSTGCNGFSGSAEVGDEVITFEPLLATKKGCSGELGQIDSSMLSVLRGEVSADVAGDSLTLTNTDGETLVLTVGEPPSTDL